MLAHAKGWDRQPIDFNTLDFMNEANSKERGGYHFWPANLYSAGHAHLDPTKSAEREKMIQGRDRSNQVLIGDSGGFQAATGVLDFDWSDPMGPDAIAKRIELLKWLEHTADYSMVLDWPAWAIETPLLPDTLRYFNPTTQPLQRRGGGKDHDTFLNCLEGTVWNNEFFVKNRTPGKTKFLNVLQGRSIEEADEWYAAVTPFSKTELHGERAFEGWALGGSTGGDPSLTIRLLLKLRDDGLLDGDDRWIHVLGRSRLSTAVYLAALNESMSRNINKNIQISYDASSAFLYAVNGNYVTDFICTPQNMNLISTEFPMDWKYIDHSAKTPEQLLLDPVDHGAQPFPYIGVSKERLASADHYKSPLSLDPRMTMDQFILAPMEGKPKPKGYRMDTASYYYIMAHNVQMQCHAVEHVCDKLFAPDAAAHIPSIFLEYKDFVNRVFTSETPMSIIEKEAMKFKDLISGERPGVQVANDFFAPDASFVPQPTPRKRPPKAKKIVEVVKQPELADADLFTVEDKQANG